MAQLDQIIIEIDNDGISAECRLCEGRRRFTNMHGAVIYLSELVDAMTDHLERNHPEPTTSS